MTLTDRYLAAIGRNLPKDQADDIVAELRDLVLTRREAKEEAIGRPLGRAEEDALLKDIGHPLVVAARYGRQQYLIGPEIYPFFAYTLKLVLIIVGAALVTVGVVSVLAGGDASHVLGQTIGALWTGGFAAAGAVTVVFALIERYASPSVVFRNWRPHDLPQLSTPRQSRWNTVSELTAGAIFVLWWTGAISFPNLVPTREGVQLSADFAPVWQTLWWPVLGVVVAKMIVNLVRLVQPGWRAALAALSFVCAAAGLVVLALILRSGHWIDISAVGIPDFDQAKIERFANIGVQIALIITGGVWTLEALGDLRRLWQARQTSPGS
jgi:hypothetical protein